MQRRLIIMRHAKSAWNNEAPNDHERPLSSRGRRDAPRVAKELRRRGWIPELVLSSDAVRAKETWQRMSEAFDEVETRLLPQLYLAGIDAVRDALRDVPSTTSTLMVVGHNPGWEQMVTHLTSVQVHMTTANAAFVRIDAASWPEAVAKSGAWSLERLVRPKEL
jgi:phosphohistidine phosphatase